jgi:hypothetical protein
MAKQIHEDPKILAAAERSMLFRAKALEMEDRLEHHMGEIKLAPRTIQYLAISRESGTGGTEIGYAVGERLGWKVYDKNILDEMSSHFRVSRAMLDVVDETHGNWIYDIFGSWLDRKIVPHEKFLAYLSRLLLEASKEGNAVFIGRAAQFILPRRHLLAVRIVASEKTRIRQIASRMDVSESVARQSIRALDEGRREFVERFFRQNIADPHNYDLIINVDRFGVEGAVNLILATIGEPFNT